jgi:RNA polymerase sigma-70 factor (ECF subfamily)
MDRERELALVARLRAGDADAFDAIHDAFNARLFTFLARLSNRRDLAEDLLEETWLRLVKHAHRLRADTNLAAWLFTVARHLHVSHCRARLLEDSRTAALIGLWPAGSVERTPFELVEAGETQQRMARALASLPVIYREALLLTAVEGLKPSQAAEVCGVSSEAMRQRLSRARHLLAERLAEAEPGGMVALREVTS